MFTRGAGCGGQGSGKDSPSKGMHLILGRRIQSLRGRMPSGRAGMDPISRGERSHLRGRIDGWLGAAPETGSLEEGQT